MTGADEPQPDRQLPQGEEIFLDHIGHFVADPGAATRALAAVGFAPAPTSIQVNPDPAGGTPRLTGTGNVTAMLAHGYVEVLFKTADTALGRQLDTALARHPGVHLAALAVANAAATHRRLADAGFRMQPLVEMQRPVDVDGASGTASFTLVRPEPGEMPEGRIQFLAHHTENLVWQARWLVHPNGAQALTSVLIAVDDVAATARRFERFTGRAATPSPSGKSILLDRGRIDLVIPEAFARLVPEVQMSSLPFIGAYGLRVRSLAAIEDCLRRGGIAPRRSEHEMVACFPVELGRGAWLFTQ